MDLEERVQRLENILVAMRNKVVILEHLWESGRQDASGIGRSMRGIIAALKDLPPAINPGDER